MHIRGNPKPEGAEPAAMPEGTPSRDESGSAAAETGAQGRDTCCRVSTTAVVKPLLCFCPWLVCFWPGHALKYSASCYKDALHA